MGDAERLARLVPRIARVGPGLVLGRPQPIRCTTDKVGHNWDGVNALVEIRRYEIPATLGRILAMS